MEVIEIKLMKEEMETLNKGKGKFIEVMESEDYKIYLSYKEK